MVLSFRVERYSTMPNGTRQQTACLWCLRLCFWWQDWLFFLSGKRVKWTDQTWHVMVILVHSEKILCAHILSRIIHCTWVYPLEEYAPFFGYYFFNVMLVVLQMLHIYWALLILRMFYKFIFSKVCVSVCLDTCLSWREQSVKAMAIWRVWFGCFSFSSSSLWLIFNL